VEVDLDPEKTQEKIEQTDKADLVIGILAEIDKDGVKSLLEALQALPGSPRVVVLQNDSGSRAP
jgi:hypothetical protein